MNSEGETQGRVTAVDDVWYMYHTHAVVEKDEYYGIVDSDGSWVIEPECQSINFSEHYITISYDGNQEILLDMDGNYLNSSYEDYILNDDMENILVWDGSGYGVIDSTGETIINCYYNEYQWEDGWLGLYNDDAYQDGILINQDGKIVCENYVRYFTDNDTEYITAWDEKGTDEVGESIAVSGALLDKSGTVIQTFDDRYNVGKFVKVR